MRLTIVVEPVHEDVAIALAEAGLDGIESLVADAVLPLGLRVVALHPEDITAETDR